MGEGEDTKESAWRLAIDFMNSFPDASVHLSSSTEISSYCLQVFLLGLALCNPSIGHHTMSSVRSTHAIGIADAYVALSSLYLATQCEPLKIKNRILGKRQYQNRKRHLKIDLIKTKLLISQNHQLSTYKLCQLPQIPSFSLNCVC